MALTRHTTRTSADSVGKTGGPQNSGPKSGPKSAPLDPDLAKNRGRVAIAAGADPAGDAGSGRVARPRLCAQAFLRWSTQLFHTRRLKRWPRRRTQKAPLRCPASDGTGIFGCWGWHKPCSLDDSMSRERKRLLDLTSWPSCSGTWWRRCRSRIFAISMVCGRARSTTGRHDCLRTAQASSSASPVASHDRLPDSDESFLYGKAKVELTGHRNTETPRSGDGGQQRAAERIVHVQSQLC